MRICLSAFERWGMGVDVAKAIINAIPATPLNRISHALLKLSAVMWMWTHRMFVSHMASVPASPDMETIPHPKMRMTNASSKAMITIRGMRMFVEYHIRHSPRASVKIGTIIELVMMLAISAAIMNRSFPNGAQPSMREL